MPSWEFASRAALGLILVVAVLPKVDAQCSGSQFQCTNTNCVENGKKNNGIDDCGDNSDEVDFVCPLKGPQNNIYQFHCLTGKCLPILPGIFPKHDDEDHCDDGSDEKRVIGDRCNTDTSRVCGACTCQYSVPFSRCNSSSVCHCWDGYMSNALGNVCTKRVLGDPCGVNLDCTAAIDDSQCLSSTCQCAYGFMQNGTNYCQKRQLYDPCGQAIDCSAAVSGSTCSTTECICDLGYMEISLIDCTRRKIGDPCGTNPDCTNAVTNSECRSSDNSCQCTDLYLATSDRTQCKLREIGDSCTKSSHCTTIDANADCTDGKCQCILGYYNDNNSCIKLGVGEGTCRSTADCLASVDLTVCTRGKCECQIGYYYDTANSVCKKLTLTSGFCTSSSSCAASVPNSECIGGSCTCITGYKQASSTQCTKRTLNDTCSSASDCSAAVPYSQCSPVTGKCECAPGYDATSATSCTKKTIGSTCDESSECDAAISGSTCEGGMCACPKDTSISDDGSECISPKCPEGDLICTMPWLLAIIIIGVLLILAGLALLIYWRCKKRKREQTKVAPYEAERQKTQFDWKFRQAHGISVMYDTAEMKEPDDVCGLDGLVFKDASMLEAPQVVRSNTFTAPPSRRSKTKPRVLPVPKTPPSKAGQSKTPPSTKTPPKTPPASKVRASKTSLSSKTPPRTPQSRSRISKTPPRPPSRKLTEIQIR